MIKLSARLLALRFIIIECFMTLAACQLILTPYAESGEFEKAQQLSFVQELNPKIPSYSGFITVDKNCNSNLWFWFFPSKKNPERAPVSVWLNGGPGLSSAFGLFLENGPYELTESGQLKLRKLTWTTYSSIIYVDNPVGTGFSFSNSPRECYSRNETQIATNFVHFLHQFFKLFPEYKNNSFYLAGESYAGKYITAIAYRVIKEEKSLRLDGVVLGNAIIDPRNQEKYADNLYYLGFVDELERAQILREEKLVRDLIDEGKYLEAYHIRARILKTHKKAMGYAHWLNYMKEKRFVGVDVDGFFCGAAARRALHLGEATRHSGLASRAALAGDLMRSLAPTFAYVLERRRTLLYYGQMDLIASYGGAMDFLGKVNWSGASAFKRASRTFMKIEGKLAGYVRSEGMLTEVLIRNAGHYVPLDQPLWAFTLYNRFILKQI